MSQTCGRTLGPIGGRLWSGEHTQLGCKEWNGHRSWRERAAGGRRHGSQSRTGVKGREDNQTRA